MGRAPCCDKANVKRGPWSPEEDAKLKSYIQEHGTGGNWIALPQKIGLKRCGKSCRLRWLNYLRPNIKHGGFSEEEDNIICSLYISIGSRWSVIAAQLPGRTDNDIKNYWNTRLKKKLLGKHRGSNKEHQPRCRVKSKIGVLLNSKGIVGNSSSSSSILPENSSSTDHHQVLHHHHQQQNQYWPYYYYPQMMMPPPVSYSSSSSSDQVQGFNNDQDSIRKLLIKLGGNFSNNYQPHHHQELNFESPIYQQVSSSSASASASASAAMKDNINDSQQLLQFSELHNNNDDLVQRSSSSLLLSSQSHEEMCSVSHDPCSLEDGLMEYFVNYYDKIDTMSSSCDTNSIVCCPPSLTSDYEQCMSMITPPQEFAFHE